PRRCQQGGGEIDQWSYQSPFRLRPWGFGGQAEKSYRRCPPRALHCAVKARAPVAINQDDKTGLSRREFGAKVGAAAAGIAVGSEFFNAKTEAAASPRAARRILGANDRVVTASIGSRGQGNSLKL